VLLRNPDRPKQKARQTDRGFVQTFFQHAPDILVVAI
jgi:hypothetical protein